MNKDPSKSGMPCGCDPAINYVCEQHRDNKRCIMGHWIRRDNCPACKVLEQEETK